MSTVNMIKQAINPNLKIAGICMTLCQERTNIARSTIESITNAYGKHIKVFDNLIPLSVSASEISITSQSVYKYAGLTKELIKATQPQTKNKEYTR